MKRSLRSVVRAGWFSLIAAGFTCSASAQRLLLHYDFNESGTPYQSRGELVSPLTPRGNFQSVGAPGSGVSGESDDRAWDASANTTQGAVTPTNNAALTTPATGLDLSQLTGFTITFWFKTEQSLNSDSAVRFVYKADRATTPVGQGLTLRSLSGRLELRMASQTTGENVITSFDFATGSGYNRVNSWIFVAITWDGSTVQFYCGGRDYKIVLADGGPFNGPIVNHTGDLIIANTAGFNRGLDGLIDNFRFYDGPLTKAELEALRIADARVSAEPTVGGPVRPLAPDFNVIAAADPGIEFGATQILRLPSGRLLASHEQRVAGAKDGVASTVVSLSDDGGINWTPRATLALGSARLFATAIGVHVLGLADGNAVLSRSTDNGDTWSNPVTLTTGVEWQHSAGNVWQTSDDVAVALMQRVTPKRDDWTHADFAPVLMRAAAGVDLTDPSNWKRSSVLPLAEIFDKFAPDQKPGRFFGVPFRQPSIMRDGDAFERHALAPVGWLDANVVRVTDTGHYWYNEQSPTWHILARAHTGGAGFASLLKVVQQLDGSLQAAAETAPSGKKQVFVPLPGGESRFQICYDAITGLYWLLSTLPADSTRRFDRGGSLQKRDGLVLHFSRNLVDWCFAALVADNSHGEVSEGSLLIDNQDLVIVSCTRGQNDEPDFVACRRIHNFRDLVY